jgi:hypothetical protein
VSLTSDVPGYGVSGSTPVLCGRYGLSRCRSAASIPCTHALLRPLPGSRRGTVRSYSSCCGMTSPTPKPPPCSAARSMPSNSDFDAPKRASAMSLPLLSIAPMCQPARQSLPMEEPAMNLDELIREINPVPVDTIPGPESHEARAILEHLLSEPERAGGSQSARRGQLGSWPHRLTVVAVAAVILAVFFVPFPHVSLFKRLVAPAKVSTPTGTAALAPVEIQLVLDRTQVTAGTPIRGEARLTNTTGRAITVETCASNGWLSVGLTNAQVSYDPATVGNVCGPTVRLSPGLNRIPIVISSSFLACTQTSSQATPQLPVCTSQGEPPLPAGQYLTKIVTTGLPAGTRLPSAIKVRLLATATKLSACQAGQLAPGNGPRLSPAPGEHALVVTVTNRGAAPCTLDGYPRVRFITSSGHALDIPQVDHSQYVTASGPRQVLLGVSATAYMLVAQYRCDLGDLQVASRVQVTLPGTRSGAAFTVPVVRATGDLALCKGGQSDAGNVIAVTPVESTLAAILP